MDTPQRAPAYRWILWFVVLLLSVVLIWVSFWFTEAPPPPKIVMATGVPQGAYDFFGGQYEKNLEKLGLKVELRNTNGSVENLHLLLNGEVDVAFVQGGTSKLVENDDPEHQLRGLAAIYTEPLWVFYRGSKQIDAIVDLKGQRISIGPKQSGTEAVSRSLLEVHGIDDTNATLENHAPAEAVQLLKDEKLDVVMMIAFHKDNSVQVLLRQKGVQLMSFKCEIAYNRMFRHLNPVKIAAGLLDLREDLPPNDIVLLAPSAMLVCREKLHPRVVEQILKTAQKLHDSGNKIDAPKSFPTLEGLDLPAHEAADTFMKSGESFLSRALPYRAVWFVVQLRIFVLPLLLVWIPVFKILPALYQMRINGLLKKHYTELREMETELVHASTATDLRQRLQDLDTLRKNMEKISRKVPGLYQREVYHWRLHISLVKNEAEERLRRMEKQLAERSESERALVN